MTLWLLYTKCIKKTMKTLTYKNEFSLIVKNNMNQRKGKDISC